MTVLVGLSLLILAFMAGVCLGGTSVEEMDGELRLPEGWWVLPAGVSGGLMVAAILVAVGV